MSVHLLGVYWTMYGQTVRVIGLNIHQLRGKTGRRDLGNAQYVPGFALLNIARYRLATVFKSPVVLSFFWIFSVARTMCAPTRNVFGNTP